MAREVWFFLWRRLLVLLQAQGLRYDSAKKLGAKNEGFEVPRYSLLLTCRISSERLVVNATDLVVKMYSTLLIKSRSTIV